MAIRSKTQRSLLLAFVGSIACCGAVGVYCLAIGRLGRLEERVMLSTAAVAATAILSLAAAIPLEVGRRRVVGWLGIVSAAAALAMSLVAIWSPQGLTEFFWKQYGVTWVMAVATPHAGLLSLARLRRQWGIIQTAAITVIVILAAQLVSVILFEIHDDTFIRIAGIFGIATACGTIAVPILHRVSAIQTRETVQTVELSLSLTCPRCGTQQQLGVGRSACQKCALRFLIEIEENNCPKCGYPLYKLESAVCPECGTPVLQQPA